MQMKHRNVYAFLRYKSKVVEVKRYVWFTRYFRQSISYSYLNIDEVLFKIYDPVTYYHTSMLSI